MTIYIALQTTHAPLGHPLDLWQIEAITSDESESFDAAAAADDNSAAVWSAALPGDLAQARQMLERRLDVLVARQEAIVWAGHRLQTLPNLLDEADVFGLPQSPTFTEQEIALLQILYHFCGDNESEVFALDWLKPGGQPVVRWDEIAAEYLHFMEQMVYLLKPNLCIESKVEKQLLAQTIVRAEGNLQTVWQGRLGLEQVSLHQQTTQLTLETRQTLLLFLAQISAGAVSLAVKFNLPGGPWLALPAAFRFVGDVARRAREDTLLQNIRRIDHDH